MPKKITIQKFKDLKCEVNGFEWKNIVTTTAKTTKIANENL